MKITLFCEPNPQKAKEALQAFANDYPEAHCFHSKNKLCWPEATWIFRVVNTLDDAHQLAGQVFCRVSPHGKMTVEALQFLRTLERG